MHDATRNDYKADASLAGDPPEPHKRGLEYCARCGTEIDLAWDRYYVRAEGIYCDTCRDDMELLENEDGTFSYVVPHED